MGSGGSSVGMSECCAAGSDRVKGVEIFVVTVVVVQVPLVEFIIFNYMHITNI
jgi:hypothetical protein